MEMEQPQTNEDLKRKIVVQIADMSRLLGMMPNDDTTVIDARDSFLKLSILISQALDIELYQTGLDRELRSIKGCILQVMTAYSAKSIWAKPGKY